MNSNNWYWLLEKDNDYMVVKHIDNQDPLYGRGSWSCLACFDTLHDVMLARDLLSAATSPTYKP